MADIKSALEMLDIKDDSHWTTDGLPRLDVVGDLVGIDVTRQDINKIAKGFSRKNAILTEKAGDKTPAPTQDTESEEDVVKAELEKAKEALREAFAKHDEINRRMDAIIVDKQKRMSKDRKAALDIQAYQESQARQREASMRRARDLAESARAVGVVKGKF